MNRNIRLDWTPPTNPVIGGIRGYLLYFSPGCGTCPPSELVSNTTFTALCIGCPANGQTCVFEVRTVTEDCGLESTPLRKISIIDGEFILCTCVCIIHNNVIIADTRPIIISVSILCTEERPRTIHVEWSVSSCRHAIDTSASIPLNILYHIIHVVWQMTCSYTITHEFYAYTCSTFLHELSTSQCSQKFKVSCS